MFSMRTLELTVGVFILAALAGLLALAIQVSGLSFETPSGSYQVEAYFNNIGGLSNKARIAMSGVTIGQVTHIDLDAKRLVARVTMSLDGRFANIPKDSTASILTAGLLGNQYIGISPGGATENLKQGDQITDTQSAVVLEDLIAKFLLNTVNKK